MNICEEMLLVIDDIESPMNDETAEWADTIIKVLLQNVIRGWGMTQFEDEKGQTTLAINLIYARAALQRDCDITEGIRRVKSEVRSFCESDQARC